MSTMFAAQQRQRLQRRLRRSGLLADRRGRVLRAARATYLDLECALMQPHQHMFPQAWLSSLPYALGLHCLTVTLQTGVVWMHVMPSSYRLADSCRLITSDAGFRIPEGGKHVFGPLQAVLLPGTHYSKTADVRTSSGI